MIRRVTPFRLLSLSAAVAVLSAAECSVDDITPPSNPPPAATPTPTSLVVVSGDQQIDTVGQAVADPLVVRVDDQSGNPMSGVTVTFAVTQGGGSVGSETATTASDGQAQTSWTLGQAAGAQAVTATVTSTSGDLTVTFTATADPDAPASVSQNGGDGQQALAGSAVPVPPAVLVRDQFTNPVPGVAVIFAVTSGGGDLTGAIATTDASGVATVGSWTLGSGPNVLTATVSGMGMTGGNPVTFTATGLVTLFDIEVRYTAGTTPTATQMQAYDAAIAKWQSIIVGDLPGQPVTWTAGNTCGGATLPAVQETVEDLVIYVELVDIDGPYGILGQAGPCIIRGGSGLPALGGMLFDLADLDTLEAHGQLGSVIMHEMGHVLGFGTLWTNHGLLQDPSDTTAGGTIGNDTYFSGPLALAAFDSIGGATYVGAKVPVENDTGTYGTGSLDGHWRESVFQTELMTPSLDGGVANPLGVVSAASMADMGYQVREAGADAYVLPVSMPLASGVRGGALHLGGDIWRGPILVADETGVVLRVIRPYSGSVRR